MNEEEAESLNRRITADEIEAVIKNLPAHKSPRLDSFTGDIWKTLKEELTPIPHRLLKKNPRRGKTPKLFLWSQYHPNTQTRKRHNEENFKPIWLMNIDTNILNKILSNCIQQYIKKIINHDQVGFIPGMQGWDNIHKSINIIHHIKWKTKITWSY